MCISGSESQKKHCLKGSEKRSETQRLGNNTESVVTLRKENYRIESRRRLFSLKKSASYLIRIAIRSDHRVVKCKWTKCASKVELLLNSYGEGEEQVGRATYKGLVICGNVWGCPVCSARISRKRRDEMNQAMSWGKKNGLIPVMLTLTTRHGLKDSLEDLLDGMKNAKRSLRQRKIWRELGVDASITATEITNGLKAGWHPHFHEILFMRADSEKEAVARVKTIHSAWLSCLRKQGLDGAAAALQVQGASAAGSYITKWGAAEELTLGAQKKAKGKGRSMHDLLELADAGEKREMALWLEYFNATSGRRRRQLVWSPKLKEKVGIDEVSDEDAAGEEADDMQEPEPAIVWTDNVSWRKARPQLVNMMEALENKGVEAARLAEHGETDEAVYKDEFDVFDDLDDGPKVEISTDISDVGKMTLDELLEEQMCQKFEKSQSYPQNIAAP